MAVTVSALFGGLLASVAGCGAPTGKEPAVAIDEQQEQSSEAPADDTDSELATLVPEPDEQYRSWRLTNNGKFQLTHGFPYESRFCVGQYEQLSHRGRWVIFLVGTGEDCTRAISVPPSGTSNLDSSIEHPFPAGTYRYVIPFSIDDGQERDGPPFQDNIVSVRFRIPGYGNEEMATINEVIADVEKAACPSVVEWVVVGAAIFTEPAALERLLEAPVERLATRRLLIEAVFRVPDYKDLALRLIDGERGPDFALAAAMVTADRGDDVFSCGWESKECSNALLTTAVDRLAASFVQGGSHLSEIARILSKVSEGWPDGLVERFVETLESTSSPELREVLFFDVLYGHELLDAEKAEQRRILTALKRAARRETLPNVRKEMRERIREFEEEGFVTIAKGVTVPPPWPDSLKEEDLDERCRAVFADARKRLAFPDRDIPPVDFNASSVEPYENIGLPYSSSEWRKLPEDQETKDGSESGEDN